MAGRRQQHSVHFTSAQRLVDEAVPDKKTIYLWVSNFRQTGQTLEALKEAIRQEVAAITPEMILKVMDNYRERLQQCINIQGRHLSDVLFKTH